MSRAILSEQEEEIPCKEVFLVHEELLGKGASLEQGETPNM
jgi:hypothetical protein